jgi:hypothetical protein
MLGDNRWAMDAGRSAASSIMDASRSERCVSAGCRRAASGTPACGAPLRNCTEPNDHDAKDHLPHDDNAGQLGGRGDIAEPNEAPRSGWKSYAPHGAPELVELPFPWTPSESPRWPRSRSSARWHAGHLEHLSGQGDRATSCRSSMVEVSSRTRPLMPLCQPTEVSPDAESRVRIRLAR